MKSKKLFSVIKEIAENKRKIILLFETQDTCSIETGLLRWSVSQAAHWFRAQSLRPSFSNLSAHELPRDLVKMLKQIQWQGAGLRAGLRSDVSDSSGRCLCCWSGATRGAAARAGWEMLGLLRVSEWVKPCQGWDLVGQDPGVELRGRGKGRPGFVAGVTPRALVYHCSCSP